MYNLQYQWKLKIEHEDVIQTTEYWLDTKTNKPTFKNLMWGALSMAGGLV